MLMPEQENIAEAAGSQKVFALVKQGAFDAAIALLDETPALWQEVEADGYTLLHWGALAGQSAFVAKALAAGLQVDVPAANAQTPFMWATIKGHTVVARALIEAGANIYAKDSFGATALILAIQHMKHPVQLLLVATADKQMPSEKQQLLAQVDNNGCGPVHWAAYKGDSLSLKLLDYFDADFKTVDNTKMTPLHRVVQSSHFGVVEFLLEKEVNPALQDSQHRTCLQMAEQNQDEGMMRLLNRHLEVPKSSGDSESGDMEAGARGLRRKKPNKEKKQMDDLRSKAVGYIFAWFWIMCVSLAVFSYLMDIRATCWEVVPNVSLAFELCVPASLVLFFITALGDPGKVPARMKSHSGVEEMMKLLSSGPISEVAKLDMGRLCTTSWVLKGPRTKYCKETGACVEEFDHFCGWLNCAIGKGNHRPFIFLAMTEVSTQIMHVYLCWVAAGKLVKAESTSAWAMSVASMYPLMALMVCLQCLTAPGVMMLTMHQLRLIVVNLTTNEMMNAYRYKHFWLESPGKRKVFKNPFSKGNFILNCIDFWWTRRRSDLGPLAACGHGCGHAHG